ncbi:hypothetical protein V8E51_016503 [Hyaloscypha variabilis]
MADPLTVLGAAAAAAQLAEQAYSLVRFFSSLYGKIKDAPELTRLRLAHVEQLQSVSDLIKKTKPLQTREVHAILVACLATTEDLNKILANISPKEKGLLKRTLQSVKVVHRDDKILILLDRIEKQKSLLALCIHQLDAAQLETLSIEVSEIRTELGNTAIVINDTAEHVKTLVDITPAIADQVQELSQNVPGLLGRIQEDLKIIVSSQVSTNEEPLQKEKPQRNDPEMPIAPKSLIYRRFFLWSFVFFVILELVGYPLLGKADLVHNLVHPHTLKLYEVPGQRAKNFVGREEVLARIKTGLSSPSAYGPKIVVIRAMGGQGKTQVALEYCRRSRNAFDIFWLDATSEGDLKTDFALLSHVLDPSTGPDLETEARVSNVRRALASQKSPWLIVFDNYDDPASYNILKFIPDNKLGMVIITSRHKDTESLAPKGNRIELTGLNATEANRLLLLESELNQPANISWDHAASIVHRLGYHPLAIAQAGAYINMRNLDLKDFLAVYNEQKAMILKDTTPLMSGYWKKSAESSQEIPMSVFTTCELSIQQLLVLEDTEHRNLPDLLTTFAFLGPRTITERLVKAHSRPHDPEQMHCVTHGYAYVKVESMEQICPNRAFKATSLLHSFPVCYLRQQSGDWNSRSINKPTQLNASEPDLTVPTNGPGAFFRHQGKKWDSSSFHEALLVFRRLSLAEFSVPSSKEGSIQVSLHPLIRDWLRLRTSRDDRQKYSSIAATCVYRYLAGTRNWAGYQMTLSEKLQVIEHIQAYATNMAEYGAGQPLDTFRIPIYDWDCNTGRPAYEFGKIMHQNGHYKASEEWFRMSLSQRLQYFGADAPTTLASQSSLAGALYSQGKHAEAKQIYLHVIQGNEQSLGSEHPETLLSKMNLAPLLTNEGNYEAAEAIYRLVIASYERVLGTYDPNTIIAMGGLGFILNVIGNFEEAKDLNNGTLTLAAIVFGKSHHRTLDTMDYLGVSLIGLGQFEDAETVLQDSLMLRAREYGIEHPDTVTCMNYLSTALQRQGKHTLPTKLHAQLLEIENAPPLLAISQFIADEFWWNASPAPSININSPYRPGPPENIYKYFPEWRIFPFTKHLGATIGL